MTARTTGRLDTPSAEQVFLSRLNERVVLADGGIGSLLHERVDRPVGAFECLNLSDKDAVQKAHLDYLLAGASLIETNTYGANRLKLKKCGQQARVWDINVWGVKIARAAREIAGESALVAGSVGALDISPGLSDTVGRQRMRELFREQMEALLAGGIDLFIIETMADPVEAIEAVRAARDISRLPVVVQFAFWPDGSPRSLPRRGEGVRLATLTGHTPRDVAAMLNDLDPADHPDVVGVNCGSGPVYVLEALDLLAEHISFPVMWSAMPNAGLPSYVDGRVLYSATPEYFASMVKSFIDRGVRLIGGCCGTTPQHIAAMKQYLEGIDVAGREKIQSSSVRGEQTIVRVAERVDPFDRRCLGTSSEAPGDSTGRDLRAKLDREFVISVELDPPKGSVTKKFLEAAAALKAAGVDCINVADSPMARVRMAAIASAHLIEQEVGVDAIVHLTTRDRNLMGLQSDLLGAHALGLRNILALTGDPPSLGNVAHATPVYDLDAIGLIKVLRDLNVGHDLLGNPTGEPTDFTIGCALNVNADDLPREIERFRQKLSAGAQFVMTQPVYELESLHRVLDEISGCDVPILMGVMPLHSYKHAVYLHNEVPGITVPAHIRRELELAGDEGLRVGLSQAAELVDQAGRMISGIYVVLSFGKHEPICALVEQIRRGTRPLNNGGSQ
ncbi:MAG: bifunctional homocysteine S-methyltransferase/methylenetetrahydrofolate reductase [Limnochordia bacterium]|jgi:methionine synthase I (cobalamin-dependent)/5,10-methylenetetrahydrofolate reductase